MNKRDDIIGSMRVGPRRFGPGELDPEFWTPGDLDPGVLVPGKLDPFIFGPRRIGPLENYAMSRKSAFGQNEGRTP